MGPLLSGIDENRSCSAEACISIFSWWRISILHSFDTGNLKKLASHVGLRKDAEILDLNEVDDCFELAVPLCQHFLLGTCLNNRCLFLHPVSLSSSESKPTDIQRDRQLLWIQSKRNFFNLKETIDFGSSGVTNDMGATNLLGSEKVNKKNADSPSTVFSVTSNGCQIVNDEARPDFSRQDRYFICSSGKIPLSPSIDTQSWMGLFACCKAASDRHDVDLDIVPSDHLRDMAHSTINLRQNKQMMRQFIFKLLHGSHSKDPTQHSLCIRSCLSTVKDFLDRFSISPSDSYSVALHEEAWTTYLVILLNSDILPSNKGLPLWRIMMAYLQSQFPRSICILSLAAAVDYKGGAAPSILYSRSFHPLSVPLLVSEGKGGPLHCSSGVTGAKMVSLLRTVKYLEDMCNMGRREAVLQMLSKHLQLPQDFLPADDVKSDLKSMSMCISMDFISRDLGFALFFMLFFTGNLSGRKLVYLGISAFYMEEESNRSTWKRVHNLFRRCPNAEEMIRHAFLSCVESLNFFQGVTNTDEDSNVDSIEKTYTRSLSAIEQSILWCLSIFITVGRVTDVAINDNKLQKVLHLCDPLCYPGVFEGTNDLRMVEAGFTSYTSSATSKSLAAALLVTIDAYLKSSSISVDELDVLIPKARILCPSSNNSFIQQEARPFIQTFWKKLDGLESCRTLDCLISLVEWIKAFVQSFDVIHEDNLLGFTSIFVSICNSRSNSKHQLGGRSNYSQKCWIDSNTVFLAILFRQVSTVSKTLCALSSSHTSAVYIVRMVLAVIEASLSLGTYFSTGERGDDEEDEGENYIVLGKKTGGTKRKIRLNKGRKLCNSSGSDTEGIQECFAIFDCAAPRLQHRLLTHTLDQLDRSSILSYSVIDTLFQSSSIFTSLGCPDILIKWVLRWFDTHESKKRDSKRGGERMTFLNPKAFLKSSYLITNIFKTNWYLLSPSFLSRLSVSTLFELSFHFLRSEDFDNFTVTRGILDAAHADEEAIFYTALLRTYTDPIVAARDLDSVLDSNDFIRIYLRESPCTIVNVNDEMLKTFQEKLNIYKESGSDSVDFSHFAPEGTGSFPLQSLDLFSDCTLYLNLSNNFLTTFPSAILYFSKLVKLNISNNSIDSLPEDLHVRMRELLCLDLSCNGFSAFPLTVLQLKNLEDLRFHGNSLEYIPTQIKELRKLQYLDISNNKLKAFNSDLTHLHFLKM